MKAFIVAILCLLSVNSDGAELRWLNIYGDDPGLAGVVVQQLPDSPAGASRWRGRHPAMILFVFWDGRVRQRGYSPTGAVEEDFWWHITPAQKDIWKQVDYSKGSDPQFRRHADPRNNT